MCIFVCIFSFTVPGCGERQENCIEEYFGKETYAERGERCKPEDEAAVQPVLELAEEAFSFDGTEAEALERFGVLARYSIQTQASEDDKIVSEKHKIRFVTAKLDGDSGYMWVDYSQTGFNNQNEMNYGSEAEARWALGRVNDEWVVTEVQEAP